MHSYPAWPTVRSTIDVAITKVNGFTLFDLLHFIPAVHFV